MKAIIVDDEQGACKNMQTKLKQIPQITESVMFTDPLREV